MKRFISFLKYNNVVPISFTILMVGSASAYAATNPEVIVDKKEQVVSIDNSYIADVNLLKYSPTAIITSVKEDDVYYYIEYTLRTIELKDAVWQDVALQNTMRVEKSGLGEYRDLGLYVTDQLKELIDHELQRLKETQKIERSQRSQKKVAVEYSGLVGGFLSEKVETIKGYKPVIVPPEPEKEKQTFARPDPNAKFPEPNREAEEEESVTEEVVEEVIEDEVEVVDDPDNERPVVTVLGEKVVRVALNESYTDLGATVFDDRDTNIVLELYLNDIEVENIVLDTSIVATYIVTYFAEDSGGKTDGEIRTIEVYDPSAQEEEGIEPETGTTTIPVASTTPEETPDQEPEEVPDPEPEPEPTSEPDPVNETEEGSESAPTNETGEPSQPETESEEETESVETEPLPEQTV